MSKAIDEKAVCEIIKAHGSKPDAIIAILQEIQERYHYLPQECFALISREIGVSMVKVYSVATFYENYSLEPKGKYVIKCCDGTACHIRKSIPILEALRKELGLSANKKTTDDMLFTVETVACLGACGMAPVLTVNDKVHASMTPEKALGLVQELREAEK